MEKYQVFKYQSKYRNRIVDTQEHNLYIVIMSNILITDSCSANGVIVNFGINQPGVK